MSDSTFKAIEHKVNWALCIAAAVITAGVILSTFATAKSMTDAESSRNAAKLELYAQRKVIIDNKHSSKSAENTDNLDIHKNTKSSNTNRMPVLDELAPAFKKVRLI